MLRPGPNRAAAFVLLAACGAATLTAFQPATIQYGSRGFYKEGVRNAASSGAGNLYLLAALIDYDEPYPNLPPNFRASFYLPPGAAQREPVYLTIREQRLVYFYWLDDVQPPGGWQPGRINRFEWPTGKVVQHLTYRKEDGPLSLSKLAAAARLGRNPPRNIERVAPVALYHSRPPQSAEGYRFVFFPDRKMRLTLQLFREGSAQPLDTQRFPSVPAALPKEFRFAAKGWPDGSYRLTVTGYAEDGPVNVEVHFYHRRNLGP